MTHYFGTQYLARNCTVFVRMKEFGKQCIFAVHLPSCRLLMEKSPSWIRVASVQPSDLLDLRSFLTSYEAHVEEEQVEDPSLFLE